MHRGRSVVAVAVAFGLAACDPLVRVTLDVAPPRPAGPGDPATAAPDSAATAAAGLAALARLAEGFGLQSTPPVGADCPRRWQGPVSRAGAQFFVICARPLPPGGLRVDVSEVLTRHWSPRGDSLRRAAADTLARVGAVTTRAGS